MITSITGALAILTVLTGCGDSNPPPPGPCWPLQTTPGGEVEAGTGDVAFEPMPDTLLINADTTQSDPYIVVNARIRDLPPGNPDDFLDPSNPKTKVSVAIAALGVTFGVSCPATVGYSPSPDESGSFDLVHSLRVGFGTTQVGEVSGQQATVTVEVVGSNSVYAKDSKAVTLMSTGSAGSDAGVPDAPGS